MAAPTAALARWVMALKNDNAQREYYLTDIVAMAVADGVPVVPVPAADETEVLGVNSPLQLAELERRFQRTPGRGADGGRRAPGRPGALRPARHAGHRQRCRDRRQLRLRGPVRWPTACASARTA
jgi:hypothetical protein